MSTTSIVNMHSDLLPRASRAWHLTVDWPRGNVLPEGGWQVTVTCAIGSHLSEAVAVNVTTAPAGDVHSTVMGLGQASSRGVSQLPVQLVTRVVTEALSPLSSSAVTVIWLRPLWSGTPVQVKLGSTPQFVQQSTSGPPFTL